MTDEAPQSASILITSYSPARNSGRGLRTCGVIAALARGGEVSVAYVPFAGEAPAADLASDPRVMLRAIPPSRGPRRLFAFLQTLARGAPWGLAKAALPQAAEEALRANPDARVIADGPTMAAALLGVARKRELIYLAHNVESSFRGTWVLRRFERRILRTFAESWMASNPDVRLARELAGPELEARYVPNVIDVAALRPRSERPQEQRILFAADLTYLPNRNGLVFLRDEVMALVWQRLPQARLVVVGRGPSQPPSDSRVEMRGFVKDLEAVYAEVDCAAVPLLQGGGSPLKFIEAMGHGLPVVATPRAAAGLEVQAGEHFCEAASPEAFAQALIEVLSGAGQAMGERARQLVERHYSIEALAEVLRV
jgi:glycosyltransferase involved in cell wall biosynthesis